ncbi:hypothetical protein CAMRE0001_2329 [Campylobacter rectus RM3267]|uniref:Uncharacterized protein n=1 Tax=Campylobacter rectus RM3267 TaxID=553218 RepID=B9D5H1_CAMRE|nr:hypothetical protein CAMRE0001_2329 [Campylobacter rectus RM3267]
MVFLAAVKIGRAAGFRISRRIKFAYLSRIGFMFCRHRPNFAYCILPTAVKSGVRPY